MSTGCNEYFEVLLIISPDKSRIQKDYVFDVLTHSRQQFIEMLLQLINYVFNLVLLHREVLFHILPQTALLHKFSSIIYAIKQLKMPKFTQSPHYIVTLHHCTYIVPLAQHIDLKELKIVGTNQLVIYLSL